MSVESEVRAVVEKWTAAVSSGDRKGVLAHHSPDVLMYDFPAEVRGIKEYDKTWDFFYSQQAGPITFAPSDIEVTASEEVAFVSCMVHCNGTAAGPLNFRLTTGLKKINDQWTIVHEHHSVPTKDQKYIDES